MVFYVKIAKVGTKSLNFDFAKANRVYLYAAIQGGYCEVHNNTKKKR